MGVMGKVFKKPVKKIERQFAIPGVRSIVGGLALIKRRVNDDAIEGLLWHVVEHIGGIHIHHLVVALRVFKGTVNGGVVNVAGSNPGTHPCGREGKQATAAPDFEHGKAGKWLFFQNCSKNFGAAKNAGWKTDFLMIRSNPSVR